MSTEYSPTEADRVRVSFVQTLLVGLRVIGSEVAWNLIRRLRVWEITQLQKRLDRELAAYGRLLLESEQSSEPGEDQRKELDLARKQIDFLRQEIAFLTKDLRSVRQTMIAKRRAKWAV